MLTDQIQQKILLSRQECFVKNIFSNESSLNSNVKLYESKISHLMGNLNGKKVGQKSLEKSSLSIRRIYGSLNFNHQDKVQYNNRGSIQDNVICSDAILKNEKKKQAFIQKQNQKRTSQEKQLRKFPVNVNLYNKYLKTEQIADAYYFVDRQVEQARKRQKKKQQTIKRVQSLSRSKSKEQSLEFRNKEKLNFNCVKHVQELKQKYTKKVVPQLVGAQCHSNKYIGATDKNLFSIKTMNSIQTRESLKPQINNFNGKSSQSQYNSKIQSQSGFFSAVKPVQQTSLLVNSSQKLSIYTSRMLKESKKQLKVSKSKSIDPDSLMKKLQKSKSTEEFLQKQRVKVIKQAFIQNWRQGQNKKQQKYMKIYPCKYTQKLNQQKQKQKDALQKHLKQQMYGKKYFKKNLIKNLPEKNQGDMLVQRYNTLKQYQLEFDKIAKNHVKSCVVAKN